MSLRIFPISFGGACAFIDANHRHRKAPRGHKFSICVRDYRDLLRLRGVATIGRPVARELDDGLTLEINRVATDGARNGCSILYGAARRAAFAQGYQKIVTYTLTTESGASLRAAGFDAPILVAAHSNEWDCLSRPRKKTGEAVPKWRWESHAA